jgi:N-acetylglucosaminyldiphosphoundecaprenol N-acetyl-beta-D-mannosaminyltransferase
MTNRVPILGVPVSVVDRQSALEQIGRWIEAGENRYVCATDVHSVMQAQRNPDHMDALQAADMVIPDGTPLVWVSRARGHAQIERVCGPDIMRQVCEAAAQRGWRIYFFGGAEGVADIVASNFQRQFPGLIVAGTQSPPYRKLSPAEMEAAVEAINDSRPDVVWIGLGCPKQEIWMLDNVGKLNGAVAIGVGAAFDFHSGRVPRAPRWMRSNGLEWLHRLVQEPGRLWRRYLLMGPDFIVRAAIETWRMRRLSRDAN